MIFLYIMIEIRNLNIFAESKMYPTIPPLPWSSCVGSFGRTIESWIVVAAWNVNMKIMPMSLFPGAYEKILPNILLDPCVVEESAIKSDQSLD